MAPWPTTGTAAQGKPPPTTGTATAHNGKYAHCEDVNMCSKKHGLLNKADTEHGMREIVYKHLAGSPYHMLTYVALAPVSLCASTSSPTLYVASPRFLSLFFYPVAPSPRLCWSS